MTSDPAARLRDAGLRVTAARMAVIRALEALGGHRTADEIGAALGTGGAAIPRASLYHALGALTRAEVVLVADAGPGTTRYEVAAAWHHHLVCRGCGAISTCRARPEPACLEPELPGAHVDEAQVIYRGLCASCARPAAAGPTVREPRAARQPQRVRPPRA